MAQELQKKLQEIQNQELILKTNLGLAPELRFEGMGGVPSPEEVLRDREQMLKQLEELEARKALIRGEVERQKGVKSPETGVDRKPQSSREQMLLRLQQVVGDLEKAGELRVAPKGQTQQSREQVRQKRIADQIALRKERDELMKLLGLKQAPAPSSQSSARERAFDELIGPNTMGLDFERVSPNIVRKHTRMIDLLERMATSNEDFAQIDAIRSSLDRNTTDEDLKRNMFRMINVFKVKQSGGAVTPMELQRIESLFMDLAE